MKNFKQLAFGLLLGALVFGFSAFTTIRTNKLMKAEKTIKSRMSLDNFIVQSDDNDFEQRTSFTPTACTGSSTRQCAYSVTSTGQTNIPPLDSYTDEQIDGYVTAGYLMQATGSSTGLYNN